MEPCCLFVWGVSGAALVGLALFLLVVFMTSQPPYLFRHDSEKYFTDPLKKGEKQVFPSLNDEAGVDLSVIVPSYNEEERLPIMMDEALGYLNSRQERKKTFKYEVIVVDDGSKDTTTEVALKYSKTYGTEHVRVLTLAKNRGKGGAVRMGMLSARGSLLLFADADGATKFEDVEKLEAEMKKVNVNEDGMAVTCGSRAHLEKESIAERSVFRTFLMKVFHFLVHFLCVRGIKDTQCGFKLLTRPAARLLFKNMHVDRWAFDVDLLHLTQHFSIPIAEVAVNWTEIDGSKVTPVISWIEMGMDLFLIRLRYMTGAWKISQKAKTD